MVYSPSLEDKRPDWAVFLMSSAHFVVVVGVLLLFSVSNCFLFQLRVSVLKPFLFCKATTTVGSIFISNHRKK